MIKNAKKISIIGGSGTGKTTLTNNLGRDLNLPIYHIDGIHHKENWEIRDKKERDKKILEIVEKNEWIIDGTYTSTLKQRLNKSDLIIYLDYSTFSQLKGILGRYIKNHGREKEEIPGCKEKMSLEFFLWVLHWRKNKRNKIIEEISEIEKKRILIFKNKRALNKWYYNKFNKNIELK